MTIENQIISLDLAKRLKELGVEQESYFLWLDYGSPHLDTAEAIRSITYEKTQNERTYSAFTVAELGEMLKNGEHPANQDFSVPYPEWDNVSLWSNDYIGAENEADARAKMLIYLIENKLINPN